MIPNDLKQSWRGGGCQILGGGSTIVGKNVEIWGLGSLRHHVYGSHIL